MKPAPGKRQEYTSNRIFALNTKKSSEDKNLWSKVVGKVHICPKQIINAFTASCFRNNRAIDLYGLKQERSSLWLSW